MIQGVCIDAAQTNVLKKETTYFLFPAGRAHFFVSQFPNKKSHRGIFESTRFQLVVPKPEKLSPVMDELEQKTSEYEQLSLF
ncbi:hypothetical protein [Peribacillus muralis]|uniref:hypothetical protein n=1 Tax=Peribacillus muralis TaxID=264697 RepID=UPI003D080199